VGVRLAGDGTGDSTSSFKVIHTPDFPHL